MATANVNAIQKLYVAYFNRPADPIGLQSWVDAMGRGATIEQIGAAFAGSAEYKAAYAGMNEVQTIAAIYQNLFGREADVDGLKFWVSKLQAGAYTIDQAVQIIADSALTSGNADGKIVANRIEAAKAFTNAIDTTAEIIGYSGDAANNAAKTFLSNIKSDDSLTTAITPANLDKSVAAVITEAQNAAGQKYVLTTGVDTLVGTSANDTFTINTYTAAGTNATTLQSFDSIDGGAGTDTLNVFAASGLNTSLVGSVKNVELINITGSDYIGSSLTATQLKAIADARTAVATAETTLASAKAADTAAAAAVTSASAAATTIQVATLSAQEPTTVANPNGGAAVNYDPLSDEPYQTTPAFNAIVSLVSGLSASQASKDFVLNFLRTHYEDIFTGVDSNNNSYNYTANQVFQNAIDAVGAALGDYEDMVSEAATKAHDAALEAGTKLTTANTDLTTAESAANQATVSAAFFEGSTQIKVDGIRTTVSGVTGQNVVFTSTDTLTNKVTYGSSATTGTVTLAGGNGSLDLSGSKLATVNLNGTVTKGGTVTLSDGVDIDTVKTLNLGLTSAAKVNVTALGALTTIAAGASTGALEIIGAGTKVSSITTGSGNDKVSLSTELSSTVKTASVATGAGNDTITVNLSGTGTGLTATVDAGDGNDTIKVTSVGAAAMTIKAGAGNDTVIFNDLDTVATADLVDGGEGTDTIAIRGATLRAADYVVLTETVTNFEGIAFLGGETSVDASRIASYKTITLSNAEGSLEHSEVVDVANDQTVNIKSTYNSGDIIDISAAGYDDTGATTVYAGALNVNVSGITPAEGLISVQANYGVDVNVFASSVNLAVSATATSDSYVNLGGDVKSATVTLASAAVTNATTGAQTGLNTAEIVIETGEENSKLASLVLKGDGYANVRNADGSSLVTVDASALTSHYWDSDDKATAIDSALDYTSYNTKAETITLGAGQDYVDLRASTFKATDTVTGLTLVVDVENSTATNKVLDWSASDSLEVGTADGHIYQFTAVEAEDLTGNSLNTVLRNLGLASAAEGAQDHNFVFQFQGNTYVYADIGATAGTFDGLTDNDLLVKLTGTIDLDLLKQALNND